MTTQPKKHYGGRPPKPPEPKRRGRPPKKVETRGRPPKSELDLQREARAGSRNLPLSEGAGDQLSESV